MSKSQLIRVFTMQGIENYVAAVERGDTLHLEEVRTPEQVEEISQQLTTMLQANNVHAEDMSTEMRRTSLFLPDYLEELMNKADAREEIGKGKILRNATLRALMEIAHEHDESQFADEINAPALTDFEADEDLARRIYAAVNQWFDEPETKGEEHDKG